MSFNPFYNPKKYPNWHGEIISGHINDQYNAIEMHNRIYEAYSRLCIETVQHELENFKSENVVLPKGENRDINADFWHEVIENGGKYFYKNGNGRFVEDSIHRNPIPFNSKNPYRLTPPEPIYEWQWTYADYEGNPTTSSHCTDEEAERLISSRTRATKLEWTKRERK